MFIFTTALNRADGDTRRPGPAFVFTPASARALLNTPVGEDVPFTRHVNVDWYGEAHLTRETADRLRVTITPPTQALGGTVTSGAVRSGTGVLSDEHFRLLRALAHLDATPAERSALQAVTEDGWSFTRLTLDTADLSFLLLQDATAVGQAVTQRGGLTVEEICSGPCVSSAVTFEAPRTLLIHHRQSDFNPDSCATLLTALVLSDADLHLLNLPVPAEPAVWADLDALLPENIDIATLGF